MASSPQINALNEQLRMSPAYTAWMQAQGIDPSRPIRLSDGQRKAFASYLRQQGIEIPKGAEIDPAGNINEAEGFGKQLKRWGPIAGGGALAAFGLPGVFPGLIGGGGGAAGGALATSPGYTKLGMLAGMNGGASAGARSIPWLDLAFSAIPSIGGLIGTKMQVGAADRSAQIGADAFREGQRNLREMYETDRADFAPYREAGGSAMARMTGLLGQQNPPTLPASVQRRMSGPGDTYTPPQRGATETVLMEAPTGEQKQVPAWQVAMYEARGARRV